MRDYSEKFETEFCKWHNWEKGGMLSYVDPELHMHYPVAVYRLPSTTIVAVAEDIADAVPYLKTMPQDISFVQIMDDLFTDISLKPDMARFTVLDPDCFIPCPGTEGWTIRPMESSDKYALATLLKACTRKERIQGAVSVEDPVCLGLWDGDTLISCASVWYWGDVLADMGVVTHPDYRARGAATMLVSRLCEMMLSEGRMPLYRYEVGNDASEKVSLKLGFTPVACLEGAEVIYEETKN